MMTPYMVQVSWLRWSDMSVLTVGGLVFSSDPRLLVTMTQLSPSTVSWKLYISRCVAWSDIKHKAQIFLQFQSDLHRCGGLPVSAQH